MPCPPKQPHTYSPFSISIPFPDFLPKSFLRHTHTDALRHGMHLRTTSRAQRARLRRPLNRIDRDIVSVRSRRPRPVRLGMRQNRLDRHESIGGSGPHNRNADVVRDGRLARHLGSLGVRRDGPSCACWLWLRDRVDPGLDRHEAVRGGRAGLLDGVDGDVAVVAGSGLADLDSVQRRGRRHDDRSMTERNTSGLQVLDHAADGAAGQRVVVAGSLADDRGSHARGAGEAPRHPSCRGNRPVAARVDLDDSGDGGAEGTGQGAGRRSDRGRGGARPEARVGPRDIWRTGGVGDGGDSDGKHTECDVEELHRVEGSEEVEVV